MADANTRARQFAAMLIAALLAACGGGGSSSSLPTTTTMAGPRTNAQFTITIPPKAAQAVARNPKYISASTESVIITLVSVNGNAYTGTSTAPASLATNLTPSSPNCATSGSNLVCTAGATAVAGSDLYSVATYDATQTSTSPTTPAGNLLSQGSTTLAVTAGQTASGTLVLNGVVASLAVAFASNAHVSGTQAAGFTIVGNQPRTFTVNALDPDGNTIVGPGAPTFTVSSGSSAVAIASTATAGTYTAQVTSYSATPAQITATPSSGSAVNFNIAPIQELWVANSSGNNVTAYNASTGTQLTGDTITGLSTPFLIQTGPNDDLWISNFNSTANSIEEVVPETNTAALTIAGSNTGINGPFGIAFDSSGNLYLANGDGNNVEQFSASSFAGHTGSLNISPSVGPVTTSLGDPVQIGFDSSGVLWVSNNDAGIGVSGYSTSLSNVALINGPNTQFNGPGGACFNGGGQLWITDTRNNALYEFSTAGLNTTNGNIAPLSVIQGSSTGLDIPLGCAFDAAGNLWVGSDHVNKVFEFAAGSLAAGGNLAPITTLTANLSFPTGVTFTP